MLGIKKKPCCSRLTQKLFWCFNCKVWFRIIQRNVALNLCLNSSKTIQRDVCSFMGLNNSCIEGVWLSYSLCQSIKHKCKLFLTLSSAKADKRP